MKMPRIMLAAPASGSGKTLITCGILQALKNRGLKLSAFKCGPDYIDPMFHSRILGISSKNLDTYFTDEEMTRYLLEREAKIADFSVLEGVMGYYDGLAGISTKASAYDVAKVTKTPVECFCDCFDSGILAVAKGQSHCGNHFESGFSRNVPKNERADRREASGQGLRICSVCFRIRHRK